MMGEPVGQQDRRRCGPQIDASSREGKVDNDIVGQRYVATDGTSIVWVVIAKVEMGMDVPHVRLRMSDDPTTTKLIALNALPDGKLYRKVE